MTFEDASTSSLIQIETKDHFGCNEKERFKNKGPQPRRKKG